jgi:hypothetical protein
MCGGGRARCSRPSRIPARPHTGRQPRARAACHSCETVRMQRCGTCAPRRRDPAATVDGLGRGAKCDMRARGFGAAASSRPTTSKAPDRAARAHCTLSDSAPDGQNVPSARVRCAASRSSHANHRARKRTRAGANCAPTRVPTPHRRRASTRSSGRSFALRASCYSSSPPRRTHSAPRSFDIARCWPEGDSIMATCSTTMIVPVFEM